MVEGLQEWLDALGAAEHLEEVVQWCKENKASFLEEIVGHADDLAAWLALNDEKRARLVNEGHRALHASQFWRSSWCGNKENVTSANTIKAFVFDKESSETRIDPTKKSFHKSMTIGFKCAEEGRMGRCTIQGPLCGVFALLPVKSTGNEATKSPGKFRSAIPCVIKPQKSRSPTTWVPTPNRRESSPVTSASHTGENESQVIPAANSLVLTKCKPSLIQVNGSPSGSPAQRQESNCQLTPLSRTDLSLPLVGTPSPTNSMSTPLLVESLNISGNSSAGNSRGLPSEQKIHCCGISAAVDTLRAFCSSTQRDTKDILRISSESRECRRGSLRSSLIQRVSSKTTSSKAVPIDEGQTGAVYALESDDTRLAIFKPLSGENFQRRGLSQGEGAIREEAAYLVDRLCGSQAGVPVTSRAYIEVKGELQDGSVQAFVQGSIGYIDDYAMPRDFQQACQFVSQQTAEAIAILDLRICNTDRHGGNLLLLGESKPHGLGPIDHGCCLPPWWALGAWFPAWDDWPQLKAPPSDFARKLVKTSVSKLEATREALQNIGISIAGLVTLQMCTCLADIAICENGMSLVGVASLMVRSDEHDLREPSWFEERVFAAASRAGVKCTWQVDTKSEKFMVVEDDAAVQEQRLIEELQALLRRDLAFNDAN